VDPGTKRVGLAVASLLGIATPIGFLHAEPKAELFRKITAVAKDRECKGIVVGLPINMDGTEGPAAKSARAFGAELAAASGLPVDFCDERLTSFAAEKKIGEMGLTRAKRKSRVDAVAAAGILEAYLAKGNEV
jgi:putative Holliday junction resolvase